MKKLIALSVAILVTATGAEAANKKPSVPDLRPIPGKIINHDLPVINPVPVRIERPYTGELNASGVIPTKIKIDKNSDLLPTDCRVPGGYHLSIGPDDISAVAYDEDGAFYAQQTINQIMDDLKRKESSDLPMMEIYDYPALGYRGLVEGFYGNPWSHETRLSLIDFMGRHKMNTYVYGPKDDPYHRTPFWRQPYPEDEGNKIKELVERSKKNRVNFVWAIHPGGDIRWDEADNDSLINKFQSMYDLGVRQFAIFFDDIKGKGTDSRQQTSLLNKVAQEFVASKSDMKNLIVCPTDYAQNRADGSPTGQLTVYGKELDPSVEVFWTGKVVCGDIEPESLEFVDSRIKRPALVWWNFPVTDYCKHNLLLGPVYGLDTTLTKNQLTGIVSNPMEYGEASKSALYGVADYAWNPVAYNPLDNWTRSFVEVMPGAPEAYGVFAIHSADPPKNYRRNESWNVETFSCANYTPKQFNELKKEFEKIKGAGNEIIAKGENISLIIELAPWLVEFENLGQRGLLALDLIKIKESGDNEKFLKAYNYLNELNKIQNRAYLDYRSGTLKLQPFIDNVLVELAPGN